MSVRHKKRAGSPLFLCFASTETLDSIGNLQNLSGILLFYNFRAFLFSES